MALEYLLAKNSFFQLGQKLQKRLLVKNIVGLLYLDGCKDRTVTRTVYISLLVLFFDFKVCENSVQNEGKLKDVDKP